MPTVGEILSTERRRQGKQLTDVVEGTKIRGRLLDALEQGRYDDLPSPAYVKGYIQSYARYLEIPAEPLLEQFKSEAGATVRRSTPIDQYLAAIPAETVVPKRGTAHEIPRNVWIGAAIAVVVIFLLLCGITQCTATPTANTNPAAVPTGTSTPASATATAGATSTSSVGATAGATVTTSTAQGGAFTLRISIRAGMATTVKITVDGLSGFDGTMQGGESREFRVNDRVVLTIGKPDAVVVTRDGKPVTIPATAGAQVTLTTTD
jgi:cytoskeletal protein RodZ